MSSVPETIPSISKQMFRRACSRFATGVAVATVRAEDGSPHGLTVNSFTSVSATPPLVLICVDHQSGVIDYFRQARSYAVNVLAEDQQALSERFARKAQDRFEGLDWHEGDTGAPLLECALAWFECRMVQVIPAGDHDIFLAEAVRLTAREDRPLIYFASGYRRLASDSGE